MNTITTNRRNVSKNIRRILSITSIMLLATILMFAIPVDADKDPSIDDMEYDRMLGLLDITFSDMPNNTDIIVTIKGDEQRLHEFGETVSGGHALVKVDDVPLYSGSHIVTVKTSTWNADYELHVEDIFGISYNEETKEAEIHIQGIPDCKAYCGYRVASLAPPAVKEYEFKDGTTVMNNVTLKADVDYIFTVSYTNGNGNIVILEEDTSLSELRNESKVTIKSSSGGSVSQSIINVENGTTWTTNGNKLIFGDGTTITATPSPNTGYYSYLFNGWSQTSGTVNEDTEITANFTQSANTYGLILEKSEGVKEYKVNGVVYTKPIVVGYLDKLTVEVIPAEGYNFLKWDDNDGRNPRLFTMDSNIQVKAMMTLEPVETFTVTSSSNDGGSITPEGTFEVTKGGSMTFKAVAEDGYKLKSLKVDGVEVTGVEYTMTDITENRTIVAEFESTTAPVEPNDNTILYVIAAIVVLIIVVVLLLFLMKTRTKEL